MTTQTDSTRPEPIAIVGSGCRFPGGANSASSLWRLLENPPDLRRDITPDRFSTTGFYHHDNARHGSTNVRHSYLLDEDVRVFDTAFFNISPSEAEAIDPQQRLLLETVYEALEAGGHTLESLRGSDTSVYVGTMTVDYLDTLLRDHNTIPKYFATGINRAIISNRVSYFFDWHGPSMTIDTACSSSLVAVHQGVQSLRSGESQVSVACGTQVLLGYDMYIGESNLKMLSPNGRSRMWDADADGYARGEGVAAIVMKRLSDAVADGDHIECIIRETGANQDGFSSGLTVPSAEAQAALIRQTYARAGLDPENKPGDRPQYFEAHGTGTQAGDPREAAAIYESLGRHISAHGGDPLQVGSIKTVVGHLEGAAGLAGLLKASSSLQNKVICPNLAFCRLNPKIEPFYKGLQVPIRRTAWPRLPDGGIRRASVNSFGFGGANAHCILEEHVGGAADNNEPSDKTFAPFVFSALTETSLVALLQQYSQVLRTRLQDGDRIDAADLAWTLHSRRSQLHTRATFPASTLQQLSNNIDDRLAALRKNPGTTIGVRSSGKAPSPRLLGVFTGQGAQWPAMGAGLIRSSSFVRQRLQHLEDSLASLPAADRPSWSLFQEMLAGDDTSRIAEAALSQPLCTALQVVLVDLLREAGINFTSVVGHSSGEIAAAYAAGFLSAHDAIRVAYYRGLYARLAGNEASGQKGAMLAVGTSLQDARELVGLQAFKGRLAVAAHNSSASVTLSGDADAVVHAKKMLDEQKTFARLLKVDTAYHSHHMLSCGDPYVSALRACGVRVSRDRNTDCAWFSSVTPSDKPMGPVEELQDLYWRDNMAQTVLFADAVQNAISGDDQLSFALEVGPHPALKGPAMQNITHVRPAPLPYSGLLSRGKDDVEAFSDALGSMWAVLGGKAVDLQSFEKTAAGRTVSPKLVVDLPSYQWDHSRIHWSESRRSRKIRERKHAPHELLGVLSPGSNSHDMRWSNILKVSEIAWLEGHQLQGLVVFPASAYVAMAVEASRNLAGDKPVQLFEVHNLAIPKAVTFEEQDDSGVETLATLTAIQYHPDQTVTAGFSIYSGPNASTGSDSDLELVASATVSVLLGGTDPTSLPSFDADAEEYNMSKVDPERLYAAFSKLGYGYTGPFRGLSATKRKLNHASALVDTYSYAEEESTFYLVHPSTLDVAIQSAMLAYSSPGDGRLWSLHVPTNIGVIRIDPEVCASLPVSGSRVPISTTLDADSDAFSASINILGEDGRRGMIQVEDLVLKPFAPATEAEDRCMYSFTKLDVAGPDAFSLTDSGPVSLSARDAELATTYERISFYYLRKWESEITQDEWANCREPHYLHLCDFVFQTLSRASTGQHPTLRREWISDNAQDVELLVSKHSSDPTIKLISAVGQHLPAAVRGQTTLLEHMESGGLLSNYRKTGLGFPHYRSLLAGMVKQITHRYPHSKILELGAGAGDSTKAIYEAVTSRGGALPSYTYTDPFPGAVEEAAKVFGLHADNMSFKVLDIEQAPAAQGFEPHSYDIVVASNTLQATSSLQRSLGNVRQLLRPGGYLVLLETTNNDAVRFTTIMGGLPTWWLGVDDVRKQALTAAPGVWHSNLREAGFGGVDVITPKIDGSSSARPFSVMAAQAVDERVDFLRQPLRSSMSNVLIDNLVILGTKSLESSCIAEEISDSLARFSSNITILDSLPSEREAQNLSPMSTFVNLVDLDSPIFQAVTNDKIEGLKRLFETGRHILWLTRGAQMGQEPYHAASLAFCRSLSNEAAHISVATLDIHGAVDNSVAGIVAEQLLRQVALEEWCQQEQQQQLLWSNEPETYMRHGKLMIPRILPNLDQNVRLNASRRKITKTEPVSASNFSVVKKDADSPPSLVQDVIPTKTTHDVDKAILNVTSSSVMAHQIANSNSYLFFSIGKAHAAAEYALAASTTNSHKTAPIASVSIGRLDGTVDADRWLVAVTSELLAASLVRRLAPSNRILVHCSDQDCFFARALLRLAAAKDVQVSFTCAASGETQNLGPCWIKLGTRATRNVVRRMLLHVQPTHFLDLTQILRSSNVRLARNLSQNIADVLPRLCRLIDPSELCQYQSFLPRLVDRDELVSQLQDVVAVAREAMSAAIHMELDETFQKTTLQVGQLHGRSSSHSSVTSVFHWPRDGDIAVEVLPINSQDLFCKDKTYVLFGLSGQVGQSLCDWMVSNGAGCVCLTSRRPNVEQRWLESFKGSRAVVKVLAADITDRDSLDTVLQTIRATCPPIAGVVNGANVLCDAPFDGMSADMMRQAFGPKIDGSFNLDQAFYQDTLDFFILFSSISCVIGTAGQSNYVAANGYMNGLARHRRRRGLAASALDIGLILGIGVAEAAGQHVIDSLQKYGITPLSEPDFRLAFAECIRVGRADPGDTVSDVIPAAVMTSGLRTITAEETDMVWYGNPIFSHLLIDSKGVDGTGDESRNKATALPVKDQLAAATSKEAALEVLKGTFASKLRVILRIGDQEIANDAPLVELGIDSLVAVEARSWFLKALKVDIPVLKLVGGASLDEVCEMAMKKLPEELVAQGAAGNGQASSAPPLGAASAMTTPEPATKNRSRAPKRSSPPSADSSSSTSEEGDSARGLTPASSTTRNLPVSSRQKNEGDHRNFVRSEPISVGQSRFWFLRLLVEDPTTFNVVLSFRMKGRVRVGDLERAIRVVTARHESLRTCFIGNEHEAEQASQKVLSRSTIQLERKTVSSRQQAADEYERLRAHEFDLASGPLMRMMLVTLSSEPNTHFLLVNYHHIIMDMASFQIFTSELECAYNGKPLGPPPGQYPDYSEALQQALDNGELRGELEYWRGVFPAGEQPPVLPLLPMARSNSRKALTDYAIHQVSMRLDPALSARIKSVSRAQRCTPFHFYLAAFKAMLFSFVGDPVDDLTIGIADANRNDSGFMSSIGFFLNLLTLRFRRKSEQSFADAMVEARTTAYSALENSRLPFDVLLKELGVARSSSYSPFFQAFFDYRQQASDRQTWCGCQFDLEQMHPGRTAYDISLDVADLGSDVHVSLRAQKSLYDLTAANLILETYVHFVSSLAEDPAISLQDLPLFSGKQLARALDVGMGPEMISDWPATLPHRIDQVAQENAASIALVDGLGSSLTYADMMQRVEAIAEALSSAGVGSGSCVLVFQQAATDWVCSMLAIMRVGAVYVPLDLRNPMPRLAAQAAHCRPSAVLVDGSTATDAPQLNAGTIIDVSHTPRAPSAHIPNFADPNAAAAVLYTSGSTGTPKGIMIRHQGIRNEMEGYTKTYKLGAERVLQQSAFTFDFSVDQISTALVNGGMLYIVPWSKRGDPASITEIIRDQAITYTKVTPSEYSMWMQYGGDNLARASSWRFAFGGGEPMTKHVLRQFAGLGLDQLGLYNSYGPAEISIASHKGLIDYRMESLVESCPGDDRPAPCGFSLPNYATYILDAKQKPLPVGMPGEVVIGGPGVSLGYLDNKDLTDRVFIPNPYATPFHEANGWTRMHRTGDIGHLQEDGSLIFRNRTAGDTQVKLRGLRVDLRDVETNIISTSSGVLTDAVVTLRAGDPPYLVAHVVFSPQHSNVSGRNAFLEQLLGRLPIPQYMIPVLAVPLDRLPLTSHCKVDRKAIKDLALPQRVMAVDDSQTGGGGGEDGVTETMVQLRRLWRRLLPDSEELGLAINPSTSFFLVGGNSLLVVRLQSRIRQAFNVTVRLVDLLTANSLGQMARKIEESPNVGLIDWAQETAPPSVPSFLGSIPSVTEGAADEGVKAKTVLVTGATGNLARHLFPLLLADPRVGTIHCVAVRDKPRDEQQASPLWDPKIVTHMGDLSLPLLGLAVDEFRALAEQADVILHLGAVRSFWDNYHMLRPTNVHPTAELVKLAAPRRIPIHLVSTSGVLPLEQKQEQAAAASSAAANEPPADGSDGYVASKWASERLLERSSASGPPGLGVPSFVYRLLPKQSATSTADDPAHKQEVLDEFARCADLVGAAPDPGSWQGRMDLVPAAAVARWLCGSVLEEAARRAAPGTSATTRFLHCESQVCVGVAELMARVGRRGGTRVPLLGWMGRIKAVGFGYVLAAQEATVQSGEGRIVSRR